MRHVVAPRRTREAPEACGPKAGEANLRHPDTPWTADQVLDDLLNLMGRAAPAGTAPLSSRPPSLAQARAALTDSPAALAALHAQAGQLLNGGTPAVKARLAALRGHPVVVNEWASWCPPCRQEFPLFAAAHDRLPRLSGQGHVRPRRRVPRWLRACGRHPAARASGARLTAWRTILRGARASRRATFDAARESRQGARGALLEEIADAAQLLAQELLVVPIEHRGAVGQQTLGCCDPAKAGVCAAQRPRDHGQVGRDRRDHANAEDRAGTRIPNRALGIASHRVEPPRQTKSMSGTEQPSPLTQRPRGSGLRHVLG
jgi:hypothetical protein